MKVRKYLSETLTKRTYFIGISLSAKKAYKVIISNTSSCTCPDFEKHGSKLCCKHLLFVILHALKRINLVESLQNRYLTDAEITTLFQKAGKKVDEEFLQPKVENRNRNGNFLPKLQGVQSVPITVARKKLNGERYVFQLLEQACISSFPPWTNIKEPKSFTFQDTNKERAEEIASLLKLSVSNI